jgi:SAM-dependent methyltransferase
MEREFDLVADRYYEQHRRNIAASGEEPEYFVEYKVKELKCICEKAELSAADICDFGSGVGSSAPFFQKHLPKASLTYADVSQRCLEIGHQKFPDAGKFLLIEADHIPLADQSFDVIFSACVFHHISPSDHLKWLRDLFRITRVGGLVAIFEHNPLNPLTLRAVDTCPFDGNAVLINGRRLKQKLAEAGWHAPTVRYNVFFPRAFAALRPIEAYLRWLPLGAQYVVYARKLGR